MRHNTLFMAVGLAATIGLLVASPPSPASAQEAPAAEAAPPGVDVEKLAKDTRKSLVAITVEGRDGKQQGMGTGFVISADGLIATNLHVIGEARPIRVQFPDGKSFDVIEVHASDRGLDLAVLKIDAQELPALALGRGDALRQGQAVVMMGNPQGLKYSVVSGVVSGTRKFEGREMIQLAVPVEPGNSGGPVVDERGEVIGIVSMKSLVTENLGFAVNVNDLKTLLARPNPVPMRRWLTIGALDEKKWTTLFGARWKQRAGRIVVRGAGEGFGGRSLCVLNDDPPELPFEIAVKVRLDDESGAAGLIFHSDGENRHYGFYPSAGKLRLSRFDGPNVFSWKVLDEVSSPHYRRGDWNHLKVRIEKEKILCYVNDQLVITSDDDGLERGRLGLAKFRQTEAEFKQFRTGRRLPDSQLPEAVVERLTDEIDRLPPLEETLPEGLADLAKEPRTSVAVLRRRAKELQRRAEELQQIAADIHVQSVAAELAEQLQRADADIDLLTAALLVARLDDEEVEVEPYRERVDQMAREIRAALPKDALEAQRLKALGEYLFQQNGFHGSRTDYYHRANSYLNRVIDDHEGLPITLSVLYMELGRRLDLNIVGVGLPGHFVVRHEPEEGEPQLIDVFDGGTPLTRDDADRLVRRFTGRPLEDEFLKAYTKGEIVGRMIRNLLGIAQRDEDKPAMLRYLEALVAIDEGDLQSRGLRAIVRFQTGRRAAALADLDWFLQEQPEGIDLDQLRSMREHFEKASVP